MLQQMGGFFPRKVQRCHQCLQHFSLGCFNTGMVNGACVNTGCGCVLCSCVVNTVDTQSQQHNSKDSVLLKTAVVVLDLRVCIPKLTDIWVHTYWGPLCIHQHAYTLVGDQTCTHVGKRTAQLNQYTHIGNGCNSNV